MTTLRVRGTDDPAEIALVLALLTAGAASPSRYAAWRTSRIRAVQRTSDGSRWRTLVR